MIKSIHQSTLGSMLRCGEQFRRRYVAGEITPPGIAAGCGTGVHGANEVNLRQKIQTKEDLPISDMKDAARDHYVEAFRDGVFISSEETKPKDTLLNDGLNRAMRLTELYGEQVAPEIQPIEVEREFSIDVGLPLPLAGRIDMEEVHVANDLKTAGKSWSEGQIDKEIQPVFYSLAHKYEFGVVPEFRYHILVDLKRQAKRQLQTLQPTESHFRALAGKLEMFCKSLKAGIFLPANPASWWCSPKWCGYFKTCRFVGNEPAKAWV